MEGWPKKAPQGGEPGVTLMVSERTLTQIPDLEITLPTEVVPITIIMLLSFLFSSFPFLFGGGGKKSSSGWRAWGDPYGI